MKYPVHKSPNGSGYYCDMYHGPAKNHKQRQIGDCLAVPYIATPSTVHNWTVHDRAGFYIGCVWYDRRYEAGERFVPVGTDQGFPTLRSAVEWCWIHPTRHRTQVEWYDGLPHDQILASSVVRPTTAN